MIRHILRVLCSLALSFGVFASIAQTQTRPIEVQLLASSYSPDGLHIGIGGAFADFYGFIILDSLGETLVEVTTAGQITGISWSPDSQRIAVRSSIPYEKGVYGDDIHIYQINDKAPLIQEIITYQTAYHTSGFEMLWSPNGKFIATYYGVQITIRDAESDKIISDFTTGESGWDSIEDVVWHPITNALYVLDSHNGLRVYDPNTGEPIRDTSLLPLSEPQTDQFSYLVASEFAFNTDGSELAIVFNDFYQTTRIIDPVSGKTLREFRPENPDFDIRSLRWAAEDKLLVTVGAPSFAVRFWDAETGELLHSYENLLGGYVRDFAVNPDATRMVVIGGFPESAGRPGSLPLTDDVGLTLETDSALLLYLEPIAITP